MSDIELDDSCSPNIMPCRTWISSARVSVLAGVRVSDVSLVFLERRGFVVVDCVTLGMRVFLESKGDARDGRTFEVPCDPQAPLKFALDAAFALLASQGQSLDKHRLKTTNMEELDVVSGSEPVETTVSLGSTSGLTNLGPE